MRVLHLSTWNEECGIADYAKNLVAALQQQADVTSEVYPPRRSQMVLMSHDALRQVFEGFLVLASTADIVHIQHHFAFFAGRHGYARSVREFGWLLTQLRQRRLPIVATFHNEPTLADEVADSQRARIEQTWRHSLWRWHVARHFWHGAGLRQAIAHTQRSREMLIASGFNASQVQVVPPGHPRRSAVPAQDRAAAKARLGFPPHATVLSIFGGVANLESYTWAIEALKRLPSSFVLAVVGGNPVSADDAVVNAILDSWKGQDPARVRMTGFVSPEIVDLYHAATDICLAPYLPPYVSASVVMPWTLSSGRPTIASDIPAFRHLNADADCLLLVQPGAIGDLVARIQELARDTVKQADLVRRALAYASANGWDALAARHLEIYCSLMHKPETCGEQDSPATHLDFAHAARVADLFPGR